MPAGSAAVAAQPQQRCRQFCFLRPTVKSDESVPEGGQKNTLIGNIWQTMQRYLSLVGLTLAGLSHQSKTKGLLQEHVRDVFFYQQS